MLEASDVIRLDMFFLGVGASVLAYGVVFLASYAVTRLLKAF